MIDCFWFCEGRCLAIEDVVVAEAAAGAVEEAGKAAEESSERKERNSRRK